MPWREKRARYPVRSNLMRSGRGIRVREWRACKNHFENLHELAQNNTPRQKCQMRSIRQHRADLRLEKHMATEDDDKPRKKITHEIGQDLSLLSVEELTERIALMKPRSSGCRRPRPRSARRRMRRTVFSRRSQADLSPRRPGQRASERARSGTHTPCPLIGAGPQHLPFIMNRRGAMGPRVRRATTRRMSSALHCIRWQ